MLFRSVKGDTNLTTGTAEFMYEDFEMLFRSFKRIKIQTVGITILPRDNNLLESLMNITVGITIF